MAQVTVKTQGFDFTAIDAPGSEAIALDIQVKRVSQVMALDAEAIAAGLADRDSCWFEFLECGWKEFSDIDDDCYHHSGNSLIFGVWAAKVREIVKHWDALLDAGELGHLDASDREWTAELIADTTAYFKRVWGM